VPLSHMMDVPENTVINMAICALVTIKAFSNKNLCHGDIKPSNMMFQAGSRTIVTIDFGFTADFASEGTPLLSLHDSHLLPSRFVAYRALANHQHQVYPFRTAADLLAEHRLHRLRQEQAEVHLLEFQKEIFAAETNLRLLQAQKDQELARFAHFSQIANFSPSHLALHSLQDVSRVPCGVLGVQRVMQRTTVGHITNVCAGLPHRRIASLQSHMSGNLDHIPSGQQHGGIQFSSASQRVVDNSPRHSLQNRITLLGSCRGICGFHLGKM
jgi:hypothetical protein